MRTARRIRPHEQEQTQAHGTPLRYTPVQAHHHAGAMRTLCNRSAAQAHRRTHTSVKLKTLPPRVPMLGSRLQPIATPRLSDRSGHAWAKIRQRVLAEEPLCRPCRAADRVAQSTEVDHITPLHVGGTDARENLQGICEPCHKAKTAGEQHR